MIARRRWGSETASQSLGAISAIAGALTLLLGTILHPSRADPNVPLAAFTEYAASSSWVAIHLIQLLGIALMVCALNILSRLISSGSDTSWAQAGAFFAGASLAIAGALQAVDGVALKAMIDRWAAAASGPAKDTLFDTALGIRQIEVGFASMLGLFLGVTAVLYGVALTQNRRFSNWLGWLAVVGGLATVSAGVVIAHEGFSNVAMMINMPSNLLLLVWMVAVGVGIWRLRSDPAVAISTD